MFTQSVCWLAQVIIYRNHKEKQNSQIKGEGLSTYWVVLFSVTAYIITLYFQQLCKKGLIMYISTDKETLAQANKR